MESHGPSFRLSEEPKADQRHNSSRRSQGSLIRVSITPFDYILLVSLTLLLIPAFVVAHLPFRIDFSAFLGTYWMGTASHSAFVAVLLMLFGLPLEETLIPFLRRYRQEKARIILTLALTIGLLWLLGFWLGLIVTVDGLALAELMERRRDAFETTLNDLFWPGLYLFLCLILVFAFNHAIAGIRYVGTYDEAFRQLDWRIFHVDVPGIAQWGLSHLPLWFLKLLEFSYISLGAQMGAALILTTLLGSQRYGLQYVRALMIGYTIALFLFLIWPAKGPYFMWPVHSSAHSGALAVFSVQKALGDKAAMLWAHKLSPGIAVVNFLDYYISFPSMHIALVTTAIWFLRPWKRIALLMLVFDVMLFVPAIILLEWHYIIDLFGGVAVAFLAIWISGRVSRRTDWSESGPEPQVHVPAMAP